MVFFRVHRKALQDAPRLAAWEYHFTPDPVGTGLTIERPGNARTIYNQYDTAGRLRELIYQNPQEGQIECLAYDYHANGALKSMNRPAASMGPLQTPAITAPTG